MHPPVASPFEAEQLLEKRVFDVNGQPVGRVRAVEPAEGFVHAFDVVLPNEEDVWLSAADVVSAEEDVILRDEAAFLLGR